MPATTPKLPNFTDLQAYMRAEGIGLWLLYDFRGSSGVLARLLPPPAGSKRWTTRRVLLAIPAEGGPRVLVHAIDAAQFEFVAPWRDVYLSWRELHAWIARQAGSHGPRIAMEYSPENALPVVSTTDAGTVELVRSLGGKVEIVSSADLIQVCIARWTDEALRSHGWASREVARIKDEAFARIRERLGAGAPITEHHVQAFIMERFGAAGLWTADPPVVAVNEHSADPHYEVRAEGSAPIKRGDWVLIDLWARRTGEGGGSGDENIFSDITWVAYAGRPAGVPAKHREVFDTVKRARDAASALAIDSHARARRIQGWQLDDAARNVLTAAGHADHIRHRTGHSLSAGPMVHGLGVNLDNLETHDTREVLPGVGWTVEPGLYIPGPGGFGVRLEINMYNCPRRGPIVTSCVQDEIVALA